ncbi:hypothetical protein [Paludisphaera rhizosphaerae]|uniref:hypothetical protein n=1 Tax=Paludisphaera rhizosphaerae TaxID=2711216 RepID=UPI0013EDC6B2|nr:hypothetical protein [Paludisphaera rhizosphaerae]
MGRLTRLCVAAFVGSLIAWQTTDFVLHAMFAAGGYTREALVELPPWAFGVIGGVGSLTAVALAWAFGDSPLPAWVRAAVVGGLVGVAAMAVPTFIVANWLGGPSPMRQAPYLHVGLVYGVPVGLVAGALAGLLKVRRLNAKPDDTTDPVRNSGPRYS